MEGKCDYTCMHLMRSHGHMYITRYQATILKCPAENRTFIHAATTISCQCDPLHIFYQEDLILFANDYGY